MLYPYAIINKIQLNKLIMQKSMEGLLSVDEAHDQANMMNAKLEDDRSKSDDYSWLKEHKGLYKKPTAAEYQQAFEVIEELKQAAADEPEYQKALAAVMRIAARPVQELLHSLDVLGTSESVRDDVAAWHQKRLQTFEDAEKRLRDMQKQGDDYFERKNN